MTDATVTHLLLISGITLVVLQTFQIWRDRCMGRSPRTDVLVLLLGCNMIADPWFDHVAPLVPIIVMVVLLALIVLGFVSRHPAR